MTNLPRSLPLDGRVINYAGPGRPPGSSLYVDPSLGHTVEVYLGRVLSTGPHYALAEVLGNRVLPRVRVDHVHFGRVLAIGELVLMGPLQFEAAGPKAGNGWLAPVTRPTPPQFAAPRPSASHQSASPSRTLGLGQLEVGLVTTQSQVVSERFGVVYVVPGSAWRHGVLPAGSRVVFRPASGQRGPVALDVRLA